MSRRMVQKQPPPEEFDEEEEEEEMDDEELEEVDPVEKINSLPIEQRRRVLGLKAILKATREAQLRKRDKIAEIEKAFHEKFLPLFELRRKIVSGEHEPTAEEVARGTKESESKIEEIPSDDEADKKKDDKKKAVKVTAPSDVDEADELKKAAARADGGIPAFWLTAMKNNEVLEGQVMKRDEEALKALKDITSEYIDNDPRKGFKINFHFGENPFFTETVLTKTYVLDPEDEDLALDNVIGTPISWTSTANKLTVVLKEKKQRHKSGKGVRVVTKEEKCPSFFHFFDPPAMPKSDDDEDKEEDDEEEDAGAILEMDFETGQAIHEMLIPRAVYYYTGESIADMAAGMMGFEGEEEE